MSYLVLARKWRPSAFDEVVGQEHVSRTLANAIRQNRVAHALLFSGARGIGKTTTARILAKCLNCEKGPTAEPCGECESCREIASGSSMDVIEIDGASNNKVENIREIIDNVRYLPGSRNKIYIIDEVHMLSTAAFNALLKTLEEPPDRVYFVLATTEPHRIPPTIISRCQRYDFRRIPIKEIEAHLEHIAKKEEIKIPRVGLQVIARLAAGSMRDALSLFDQLISYAGREINEKTVSDLFGLVNRELLWKAVGAVLNKDRSGCVQVASEIYRAGFDLVQVVRDLSEIYRNMMVASAAGDKSLCDLLEGEESLLEECLSKTSAEEILQQVEILRRGKAEVQRADDPLFAFEAMLLKMIYASPVLPVEEVLERLEKLNGGPVGPGSGGKTKTSAYKGEDFQRRTVESKATANFSKSEFQSSGPQVASLVEHIKEKRPIIANILRESNAQIEKEKGKNYSLVVESNGLRGNIEDPEVLSEIREWGKKNLGVPLEVKFVRKRKKMTSPTKNSEPQSKTVNIREDSAVKKVESLLGGKIERIKRETGRGR